MGGGGWTALLAAGPGDLRDSLHAMLVSMSHVQILEAHDTATAIALLHEHHPDLLIIDGNLPGNHTMQLVHAAQAEHPRVRCTILVDDVSQQAAAMKAGADHAPCKGEPPPRLFAQVERLLQAA
jgi:DNA-binding NarL/FixJ family response regulator